jgi:hypothetical protein
MDAERFDRWTRGLDTVVTRRGAGAIATGALGALGLMATADAKKKKKKKKKKKVVVIVPPPPPPPASPPPAVNYTCGNLGAPCGNTLVCRCRLNRDSQQVCMNEVVAPPGGFTFCQSQVNCPAGTFCDAANFQCASACPN